MLSLFAGLSYEHRVVVTKRKTVVQGAAAAFFTVYLHKHVESEGLQCCAHKV